MFDSCGPEASRLWVVSPSRSLVNVISHKHTEGMSSDLVRISTKTQGWTVQDFKGQRSEVEATVTS